MRSRLGALVVVLLAACEDPDCVPMDAGSDVPTADASVPALVVDAFEWLADPYVAARRLPGHMRLASSRFPEAAQGFDNGDMNHFVRIDGNEAVLLDARGPGVLTRLWFTFRLASADTTPGDDARLHLYVDDAEIDFGNGERGITLGALTSGTLPAFPRPWVAGRDLSSGGLQIFVPIHFAASIRVTLDHVPERTTYYQIDWRDLASCGLEVRSFDGSLRADEESSLARATELWVDRIDRGAELRQSELDLAPGDSQTIVLAGPGVLRQLAYTVHTGDPSTLIATLIVDGETLVEAPAHRFFFASPPAGDHVSALAASGPLHGSMEYPAPFDTEARLVFRNAGAASITLTALARHDPGSLPELGRLQIACDAPVIETQDTNVTLIALSGERGHYAGQLLTLRGREWGWAMMEGDHEVRVDGEYALLGTGIEDYFGGAFYYLAGPFALPFLGAPGFDLMGGEHLRAGAIDVAQYRHHLIDGVSFEDSFAFEYEVGAPRTGYEHCIYWYRD